MLKLILGNSFVIKRLLAALTGGLSVIFGADYAGYLAELLMDPDFIKKVFDFLGTGLIIYAGIARKNVSETVESLDKVEDTVIHYLPPKTDLDPYPGWDYDPIQGWVKADV